MSAGDTGAVVTLRWFDAPGYGRLEMIDQTRLPAVFEYLSYDSAAGVADGIRTMVVRGAPAIGVAAAYGVALEALRVQSRSPADFKAALDAGIALLAASRPTAVNLFWALERMRSCRMTLGGGSPAAIAAGTAGRGQGDPRRRHPHQPPDGRPRRGAAGRWRARAHALQCRRAGQGARLTAWEMVQESIPVTLITDTMAGHLMAHGEIDAVIVGTDRVAANGDVANKIGTYMVAVLAARHHIPFYVACPLSTIDLTLQTGEVTGFRDAQWAAQGVNVRNPSFDVTPAELVTALITERGVVHAPDERKLRALFS